MSEILIGVDIRNLFLLRNLSRVTTSHVKERV